VAVTDQQFLDHVNLANAEFANRQILLKGSGVPGISGVPGVAAPRGTFWVDNTSWLRYEKSGPADEDWSLFVSGSGGGGGPGGTGVPSLYKKQQFNLADTVTPPHAFVLTYTPKTDSEIVTLNGIELDWEDGDGEDDYALSGPNITLSSDYNGQTSGRLRVSYAY